MLELEAEGAAPVARQKKLQKLHQQLNKQAVPAAAQQPSTAAQPATATTSQVVEVRSRYWCEKALVGEILVKLASKSMLNKASLWLSLTNNCEVPSSIAGTVESIQVKEGDTVKEGVVLIKVKQHLHLVRQLRRLLLQQAPAAAPAPTQQETVASTATNLDRLTLTFLIWV